MGVRVEIGAYTFEATDYRVNESATPLAAGDSSGAVGDISITIPPQDPDLPGTQNTGWYRVKEFGPEILMDLAVKLTDTRHGFTLGTVTDVSRSDDTGNISVTATSKLGELNVYGAQAQPFVGTLGAAFNYYVSLSGTSLTTYIDPTITGRPVVFPGWNGELWYYLKQMAAAQDCEINLVAGVATLRPIRTRYATPGQETGRSQKRTTPALAQSVEVYSYDNTPITNELVYPPGGWTPEVEVLNVNAGETAEYTLELSSSVSSITQPVMQTAVAEDYAAGSVYTIVANDGLPISSALWTANGGTVTFTINPDTTSIKVVLHGAQNIPTSSGAAATNFSLALASDTTGNRYSTIRILGTGVSFNRQVVRIGTGVAASRTGTEVGVTIDNIFLSTVNDVYRAGTRAARKFAGAVPDLSSRVLKINKTDGATFGNVAGTRVFDPKSRRYYRVRQGDISRDLISGESDDDLTIGDMEQFYNGKTYGQVQTILNGLTYREADIAGMYAG